MNPANYQYCPASRFMSQAAQRHFLLSLHARPSIGDVRWGPATVRSGPDNGPARAKGAGRRLLWGAGAGLAALTTLAADEWRVPDATFRAAVQREAAFSRPADAGSFLLYPCGLDPSALGVRVLTADGAEAASQVIWASAGEPLKVMFDASDRRTAYTVYFGPSGAGRATAVVPAGVVLETRPRAGDGVGSFKEVKALWDAAREPLGRSLVPSICQGLHLHGPTANFLSWYRGFLDIRAGGDYEFATVSSGASFLQIDGRIVAQWPGWHGPWEGVRGEHKGQLKLTPGRHRIDYWNAQDESGFCLEAAWKPPGQNRFHVIPAEAFTPVAPFRVSAVERAPGEPVPASFSWQIAGHSMANTNLALVTVVFNVVKERSDGQYRWVFDDGVESRGAAVRHAFLRPGMRTVKLEALSGPTAVSRLTQTVSVHPLWSQLEEWPDDLFAEQKAEILSRDLAVAPLADLASLVRLADAVKDRQILARAGPACLQRSREFSPAQADVFYALAFHFQHPLARQYGMAEQAFRTALGLSAEGSPIRERTRLHFSGFLIHVYGSTDEALALLGSIEDAGFNDLEKRLRKIYEADARLVRGDAAGARAEYLSAGTVMERTDRAYTARRRARLETARDFVNRGEYEEAERLIREIEWETPIERLGAETGLLLLKIQAARQEYPLALARCHRLLNAAPPDAARAEILYQLVEVSFAMGRREEASQALRMLLGEHPYSEAAARARDRWSAEVRKDRG